MKPRIEELDWRETAIGELNLRRRHDPLLDVDVYEVKLGDEYLMSSLFPVAEIELAHLGLATQAGDALDVVVGGLGLGYTAHAALTDDRVRRLTVVEMLAPVIDWHRRDLFPDTEGLAADPRIRFTEGDFFALAADDRGFDGEGGRVDAILLDIDHSPRHVLNPPNGDFYTVDGLRRMSRHLHPEGVFALWSNDPPDDGFLDLLRAVFTEARAEVVTFPNPFQNKDSSNTVYIATSPRRAD